MVNVLLTITASLTLILAFLTIISGQKNKLNIALFLFSISIFLWLLFSLLTNLSADAEVALFFARLSLVGPLLGSLFFLVFIRIFIDSSHKQKMYWFLLSSPVIALLAFTFTDYNISSIESYGAETQVGILYLFAVPLIALYGLWGIYSLASHYRRIQGNVKRSQIRYIVVGIVLFVVPATIINGLLPLFGSTDAYLYGPNVSIFIVFFFSLSILKHGLLDIRLIAVRALTYLVLLAGGTVLYVLAIDYLARTLFENEDFPRLLLQIGSVLVLVFVFEPIRKIIDSLTSNIFFQDNYDPQTFIEEVNKILVNNLEIEALLQKMTAVVEMNLKSEFCGFFIRDTSYYKSRMIGDYDSKLTDDDTKLLKTLLPKIHKKRISVQDTIENSQEEEIIKVLKKADIEVLVRLVSTLDYEVEGIGYLLVGPKKTGKVYSIQDLKILEIVGNELVIAVQNALRFEEIEQFNVTLQKKIDDATKELRKNNEKLKALDEAKDEFVSMASHQLRTPLTTIKGYLSMVLEGDAGDITPTQKDMLGQALFSSQRMVYLISDLLNVSRLKTGKFLIEPKNIYLPDVIETEIDQLRDGAKSKELTIEYIKPDSFSHVMLDEMKIRQVIMNFTDNAIYYTKPGGTITVGLKETSKSIEFTVTDDGIGVPKEQQHKLFAKFYRAENARKARPDGTGLGLFMAKKVIIAQEGSIVFKSKEGKGSTFGFSFPKDKILAQEPS